MRPYTRKKPTIKKGAIKRFIRFIFIVFLPIFTLLFLVFSLMGYVYFSSKTPDVSSMYHYKLQEPLHIYDKNKKLIFTYGSQRRTIIKYQKIPSMLIRSIMAAEDSRFFFHHGIDFKSIVRAVIGFIKTGRAQSGASTITMQVSKNFFLTPERTIIRKIKEIFLALKIERNFTKEQILEMYINKVYLGFHSYGFAAAANVYYGKNLNDLTIAQFATLAGLLKSPSKINPLVNKIRSIKRRNWILNRMLTLNYINPEQYQEEVKRPLTALIRYKDLDLNAGYLGEYVRLDILKNWKKYFKKKVSKQQIYSDNYKIYTTIDYELQKKAQKYLVWGLISREYNMGYRRAEKHIVSIGDKLENMDFSTLDSSEQIKIREDFLSAVSDESVISQIDNILPALITDVATNGVKIMLTGSPTIEFMPIKNIKLYKKIITKKIKDSVDYNNPRSIPNFPDLITDVFKKGDVIRIIRGINGLQLTQIPQIQGSIISMNPKVGSIDVFIGGANYKRSLFNRAVQSKRQMGSTIKPFLYSYALERGVTTATKLNDQPYIESRQDNDIWRPTNAGGSFMGLIRMRKALYLSRNLVSIRIMRRLGLKNVVNRLKAFGFQKEQLPLDLSLALGSGVISPFDMVRMYALLSNGGYKIKPYVIDRIEKKGEVIYQADRKEKCTKCFANEVKEEEESKVKKDGEDEEKPVMTKEVNFIIKTILKDVIKRGTSRRALVLHRSDIMGKTGTTNNNTDSWFAGFNSDVVTVVWVGNDNSKSLGRGAYGGSVALPIWINYMREALKNKPIVEDEKPDDVLKLLIDKKRFVSFGSIVGERQIMNLKGRIVTSPIVKNTNGEILSEEKDGVVEWFLPGTEPKEENTNDIITTDGTQVIDNDEKYNEIDTIF